VGTGVEIKSVLNIYAQSILSICPVGKQSMYYIKT